MKRGISLVHSLALASALAALGSDLSTPPRGSAICIDQVETENTTYTLGVCTDSLKPPLVVKMG